MARTKKPFVFKPDKEHEDGPSNGKCAGWAEAAIDEFLRQTREPAGTYEDAVSDLFADMLHFCDRQGIDGVAAMKTARANWRVER